MFCFKCGNRMEKGSKFCSFCGTKLDDDSIQADKNEIHVENEEENNTGDSELKERVSKDSSINRIKPHKRKLSITLIVVVVLIAILFIISELKLDSHEQQRVDLATGKIEEIGEVDLNDEGTISDARRYYDNLLDKEKRHVKNSDELEEAEKTYSELKIQNVSNLIDSIGEVTLYSKEGIVKARKEYDLLAEEQQGKIQNYKDLIEAEKAYSQLAIEYTESLISSIGEVTLDSKESIDVAQTSYDDLSKDEKAKVSNSSVLTETQSTYKELKAKADEIARQNKLKNTIRVSKIYPGTPNSAGGVNLYIIWTNQSEKTVKYAYFTAVPYNAVDDVVTCEIRRYSAYTAQDDGPKETGQGNPSTYWRWENAWYNNSIKRVELTGVRIEYMDGSSENISGTDLDYIQY